MICTQPESAAANNICIYEPDPEGRTYFSPLTMAGFVMTSIFLMPFILRPIDFMQNFKNYVFGFIAFLIMMPYYANIMFIYSICNLHDVSWGNRPATTGMETVAVSEADQARAKADYMVFRSKFVFLWFMASLAFYSFISFFAAKASTREVIDSDAGFLGTFGLYLSAIALFRIIFGVLYILKWKVTNLCCSKYKVTKRDLSEQLQIIKSKSKDGESSDDELIEAEL